MISMHEIKMAEGNKNGRGENKKYKIPLPSYTKNRFFLDPCFPSAACNKIFIMNCWVAAYGTIELKWSTFKQTQRQEDQIHMQP